MSWNPLEDIAGIEKIKEASNTKPQVIFKHSTRCGISAAAKRRMDFGLDSLVEKFDVHFLDLLSYRNISNQIAETFGVYHQSPQVLLIHQGESVYDASHGSVDPERLLTKAAALEN